MNQNIRPLSTLLASALALTALLLVGATGSSASPDYEVANPTAAECQPGQPYNQRCPTIVTFEFPKRSFLEKGKVKLVHLGCNQSCNHVNYTAKHGKKLAAKGSTWFKANYLPDLDASLTGYAKRQLRLHKELSVKVNVCVHPPGPKNFCKSGQVLLRVK